MLLIDNLPDLREWTVTNRAVRRALVPTMGALHEGHLSLCDRAREVAGAEGHVVTTIFVNPTQFGPDEDLDAYPRQLEADVEGCKSRGVDMVFAPKTEDVYFPDHSVLVKEDRLSLGLCGDSRPGHFDGVCTVVAKLFNLVQPDFAVFGQKDYQQLAVIRRMVRDLNFPVEVIGNPTVRESDGLAMSSRNAYLSPEQRKEAPIIYQSLCEVRDAVAEGKISSLKAGEDALTEKIRRAESGKIDYINIVHPETLKPLDTFDEDGYRLIAAVFFGKTRLIDNLGNES